MQTTSAVVFVLTRYLESDATQCAAYCAARGYDIAAIVVDNWHGALAQLSQGAATVLVVAELDRMNGNTPRVEVAGDQSSPTPAGRRTHAVRRTAEE
jgi:hypothetical protein